MKLSDLAAHVGLTVEGDGSVEVRRAAGIDEAGPGDITFVRDTKFAAKAAATRATAVLLPPGMPSPAPGILRSKDANLDFLRVVERLHPRATPPVGIHPTAVVAASARIGPGASIGAFVVIGEDVAIGARAEIRAHTVVERGSTVGDDVRLANRVVLREGTRLGHRVTILDGTVVGSDGFGFVPRPDGTLAKVPQVGIVVIGDDVEIHANSCIDRAALGETRIDAGTKIDNLVQVGHNCVVGAGSILCGQAGLAGSTTLGKNVMLGGQVGVAGHVTVGDGVAALAKSGIIEDIPAREVVAGVPTMSVRDNHRWVVSIPKLVEVPKALKRLEERVAALEGKPAT